MTSFVRDMVELKGNRHVIDDCSYPCPHTAASELNSCRLMGKRTPLDFGFVRFGGHVRRPTDMPAARLNLEMGAACRAMRNPRLALPTLARLAIRGKPKTPALAALPAHKR